MPVTRVTQEQQKNLGFNNPADFSMALTKAENASNTGVLDKLAGGAGVAQTPVNPQITLDDVNSAQNIQPQADIPRTKTDQILNQFRNVPSAVGDDTALRGQEDDFASAVQQMRGRSAYAAKLGESANLTGLEDEISRIGASISAKSARLTSELEGIGQQGFRATTVRGQEARARRQVAAEIAGLEAAQQAAMGQLVTAQSSIERAVKAKYGPIEEEIEIQRELISLRKDQMTRDQQKRAEERETELSILEAQIANQQTTETRTLTYINNAISNGMNPTVASSLITDVLSGKKSEAEVIEQAGSFIDRLNRQAQNLAIESSRLGIEKSKLELEELRDAQIVSSGEFSSVIDTASGLVGAERGKASKAGISRALAKNDYSTAYALIANNVEEALTGENATRFGAQRNDYVALQGLKDAIQEYADGGGDTGLLKGTAQEISNKLGQLATDPEFAELATQLQREFQAYRQQMTGAAFGARESSDYQKVNPSEKNELDLNLAIIDGTLNQLENRITSTVETRVPGANEIYNKVKGVTAENIVEIEQASEGAIINIDGTKYIKLKDGNLQEI